MSIIPAAFSKKLRLCLSLSLVNQILDFISIILLVPIIISVFNPGSVLQLPYFNFLNQLRNYPISIISVVVLFFVAKNFLSVKIIKFQSDYYYDLSNSLSVTLLQNFLNKDLIDVKATKNSSLVKDIVFVPNNFVTYVLSSIMQLLSDGLLLVFILIGLLLINPLTVLCLLLIIIILLITLYFYDSTQLSTINKTVEEKYNQNFNQILNAVNGYIEIKTNQLESLFLSKFRNSNQSLNSIYSELNTNRLAKSKHTETMLIIIISCLFLITKYVSDDVNSNVLFVSFLFASTLKIIPSINRILIGITNLKSNLYTVDILKDSKTSVHKEEKIVEKMPFDTKIELQNISFQFDEAKPLLSNINLSIKKGEIIGLIGDSGKGKSTLLNIISTLIKPNSGTILCDDKNINETNKKAFLQNIAYVSQAPFILEGTILENLMLNGESVDLETLNDYLTVFDLKKTIDLLPNKLQTFIGSSSHILSGGQLQRLAIIRALLKNSKLLLLDEATNQLDYTLKNNILIQLKIIANKQGLTIITISHHKKDLESFCDTIYELKNAELIPLS